MLIKKWDIYQGDVARFQLDLFRVLTGSQVLMEF